MSAKTIKCPRCGKPSVYAESNEHRPFCSERCQVLDLGAWASEAHAIPGENVEPESEVNENPAAQDEEDEDGTRERAH